MSALTETIFRRALQVHDAVYCNTPGWIGHQRLGVPRRLLHTVGAKTGKPRTTSLSFARNAENDLIVASIGGARRAPRLVPQCESQPRHRDQRRPRRFAVTPRMVTPADSDYGRLWQIVNDNNSTRYNQ